MQVGSYSILRELGEGGMGKVYLAQHVRTGRHAVIKSLLPQYAQNEIAIKRFYHEARVLGQLSHPAIAQLYDFFVENGVPYLVMEYVEGEPLNALLERVGKPLAWEWILRKMAPILQALAYVHSQGIIHRDLKPSNIMIIPKGGAKLLDFGIAKAMDMDLKLTQTGTQVGTALYMAPEQIRGEPVSRRTDLYAMGLILYECAFGRYPWHYEGKTQFEIYQMLLTEPPPFPKWASREERRFFERALAKAPSDRFASAQGMLEALKALIISPAIPPAPTPSSPERPPARESPPTPLPSEKFLEEFLKGGSVKQEPIPSKPPRTQSSSQENPPAAKSPQPEEDTRAESSSSSGCGVSLTFLSLLVTAVFWLSVIFLKPFGRLSGILNIIALVGFLVGYVLSGQARTLAYGIGGAAVATLLYLHLIAWPIFKGRFETSQKVYAFLEEKLAEYEDHFEEKRRNYNVDLIISPLDPPAEIVPEILSRSKNLALKPSLQVLFLRFPDNLTGGKEGKLYRTHDTLLLSFTSYYDEERPTGEYFWDEEDCPEHGFGWWRKVRKQKYIRLQCEQKYIAKIAYTYDESEDKRAFDVIERSSQEKDCKRQGFTWKVGFRGPCQ